MGPVGGSSVSSSVTATFVFTDLVDSTATAARLGPAAAEDLRQTHFRLLRGAVAASGGTEVKNLGDGLMVMFPSPSRALACAVGMQQAIEHHNRSAEEQLGVRIGISAGEAVEEDGDFFGDPVVEAALKREAQGFVANDCDLSTGGDHQMYAHGLAAMHQGDLELATGERPPMEQPTQLIPTPLRMNEADDRLQRQHVRLHPEAGDASRERVPHAARPGQVIQDVGWRTDALRLGRERLPDLRRGRLAARLA